ncbi:MAG: DDE-type integrase/transposase/recombinase [Actinobacteria bacterium]|nr:DDE-type integrase/transposase/recombinase [Actinomycetota bacterium]
MLQPTLIAGYASGRRPNSDLVVRALSMAATHYATRGTIIHSDMGSVFKSERYRNAVKQAGLVQSMGNAGLSFANQAIESFFGKLKTELLHTRSWKSYEEINRATTYYCESFYNSIRPQMVLGGRRPLEEFHRLNTCLTHQATISVA